MKRRYVYLLAVGVFALSGYLIHYQEIGVSVASEIGIITGMVCGYLAGRRAR